MSLILPPGFKRRRSTTIRPERFSFYAKHKCGGEAFWLTKRIHSPFEFNNLGITEVWFEDGQIKTQDNRLEDFNCPSCGSRFSYEPKQLTIVRILRESDYERLHAEAHSQVPIGDLCKSCGKVRRANAA